MSDRGYLSKKKEIRIMGEETYMNKGYCLECMSKHGNRLEHHLEDLTTSARDSPELREEAQSMLDEVRDMRKRIDELRLEEIAQKKLKGTV